MQTKWKICIAALSVFLVLAMSATLTMSILTMIKVNAINDKPAQPQGTADSVQAEDSEDEVMIGENYPIRSTKAIADAYLSGDEAALSAEDKETLDMARTVLAGIIRDNMSAYEKECAVFDWVHQNIHIDEGGMTLIQDDPETVSTPHGVLKHKQAVCVGFATTFRLFMEMLEIPCEVVPDESLGHAWDLVKIGDGWYHVDLYSASRDDDPWYYLNLPDDMCDKTWDAGAFPAADSYEYTWVYQNAQRATDVYTIPAELKKVLDKHGNLLSLLFEKPGEDDLAVADALLARLSYELPYAEGYLEVISFIDYRVREVDGKLLACAHINYLDGFDDSVYDIPDDLDEDKINDAIEKAFGKLEIDDEAQY